MALPHNRWPNIATAAAALALALSAVVLPDRPASAESAAPATGDVEASGEVERFCSNIADAAKDQRYALQVRELKSLQSDIDSRMAALEAKRAEYEGWLKRRQDFLERAESGVVKIYASMRPDAAAERLSEVDMELAAAILMKLDARKAGVILNEMDRKAAAALTGIMASAARKVDPS